MDDRKFFLGDPSSYAVPAAFPIHNTYHGATPHHRTPLTLEFKPIRFTDSEQSSSPSTQRRRQQQSKAKAGKRRPSAGSGDNVEVGGSIKVLEVFIGCNKYQFYDKLTLDGGIARQLCLLKAFKGVVRSSSSITVRVCQICCTAYGT